jgi:hypothetical protein
VNIVYRSGITMDWPRSDARREARSCTVIFVFGYLGCWGETAYEVPTLYQCNDGRKDRLVRMRDSLEGFVQALGALVKGGGEARACGVHRCPGREDRIAVSNIF